MTPDAPRAPETPLACPFCGVVPTLSTSSIPYTKCNTRGCPANGNITVALEQWNRRAVSPQPTAPRPDRERLAQIIKREWLNASSVGQSNRYNRVTLAETVADAILAELFPLPHEEKET